MKPKPIRLYFRVAMMLLMLLTMAQTAWADDEAPVYDLVTEVPDVDGGQSTNWNTEYDYYSLVDGNTSTVYGISNANPWVEFHYSRAFVPKKYILWTGDYYSLQPLTIAAVTNCQRRTMPQRNSTLRATRMPTSISASRQQEKTTVHSSLGNCSSWSQRKRQQRRGR